MGEIRHCRVCGKEFELGASCRIYCSAECRKRGSRVKYSKAVREGTHTFWEQQRENEAIAKREREKRKRSREELLKISAKARELGISYGKYVAMMESNGGVCR